MNGLTELFDVMSSGGGIGVIVILSALCACVVACAAVVIDTTRGGVANVRKMLRNRKAKKIKK